MRATLVIADVLMEQAKAFTGFEERSSVVREASKALIERESARQPVNLAGSEPDLEAPRRRPAGG